MTSYLSVEQIRALHRLQVTPYGGAQGKRDGGALEAAVARPQMTFGGEDLYEDDAAKAAALLRHLVMSHPFADGNQRVGAHAALLYLRANAGELLISPRELTDLTLAVGRGELEGEAIAIWLRQRTRRLER